MNFKLKEMRCPQSLAGTAVIVAGLLVFNSPCASAAGGMTLTGVNAVQQASQIVKGKILDENGDPVIGASITVKGATGGAVSDLDGNFTLPVPSKDATVQISYIGYQTVTLKASAIGSQPIRLKEDAQSLGEVVVVGYGTQKKETLTGAVTVVDSKQFESKGSVTSPLQAMQGQVPGVIITRNSGAPGDENWGMSLRGAVSANGASPLVIVDGVEYSDGINGLRLLNSDDIQSINFLKDASAAIYGSKAAGGVVLVTTKQAKAGKTVVQYNGSITGKKIGLQPKLMNLDQWCDLVEEALTNDGSTNQQWLGYVALARKYKNQYIDLETQPHPFDMKYFYDVDDFVFMDNDWQKILWGNSWSTSHDLSVSGGSDKNLFRISLGYLYDSSALKWGNNNNSRYNLRFNDKFSISDNISLTTDIAYNRQDQVAPSQVGSTLSQSTPQPGLPSATLNGKPYAWGGQVTPNWFAELGGDNKLKVSAINFSETLNWKIYKDLDFVTNLGYNTSTATRDIQTNAIHWYNYTGTKENLKSPNPTQENSSFSSTFARTDYYLASAYLNWHHTFAKEHNVSVMGGWQYNYTQYDYRSLSIKNINENLEIPNGSGDRTVGGSKWHEAMMSYYGRLNYDYQGKYLLEGLARYDGSSKFQPENRWQFFWGVSGGWRISEEKFMDPFKDLVSNLKLRLSYGVVGNQNGIDRYDGTQLYNMKSNSGAYIGSGKVTVIDTNGKIVSTERTWERIHNYNVGLDFGFLQNRLSGTVEVFWKKNNNMLIAAQYPGILGDNAPQQNMGKFKANGWEGTLNWADKIGQVSYHVGGTVTYATNELVDYGTTSILAPGKTSAKNGYPLNSYFGYLCLGKIQNEEQLKKYTSYYKKNNSIGWNGDLRLGDNMYADVNGDGKLTTEDVVYLGTDDPKLSYSFNAGAEWKGFDFGVVFQGVGRRSIMRDSGSNAWRIPGLAIYQNTTTRSIGNIWSVDNPGGYYPTLTNQQWINNYNYQISSWSIEDGSYLRLKNLTIGYTLPDSWMRKTGFLTKVRIYFTGTDLWETTKIKDGWDPEQSQNLSAHNNVYARYPFNRSYTFGLNVTF